MSQPYLGEIEFFAFNFPPQNWAICAGQLLPIAQYQALFSLLGTTYGGNGITNFMLPDLRGRLPVGQGSGLGLQPRIIGETGGEETHTLIPTELPLHNHSISAVADATKPVTSIPAGHMLAVGSDKVGSTIEPVNFYSNTTPDSVMAATTITPTGALPHANIMPFLALNACIALSGIFPSRS